MKQAGTGVLTVVGIAIGTVVLLASLAVPVWLLANSAAAGALYVLGPGLVCAVLWLAARGGRPLARWWTAVLERSWWR